MIKNKQVSNETLVDIAAIADKLLGSFTAQKATYRGVAQASGLSVNSVKSILKGSTANIASVDAVARALGTTLIDVAAGLSVAMTAQAKEVTDAEASVASGFPDQEVSKAD